MIPHQLTLKNFLSYRETQLNFRGLHVACICGPNGAGKSSLLEAIAWAVWGQSRVATEDDVIHAGAMETQVNFTFEHQQQTYRVLRHRHRQQGGSLEFQVQTEAGFRPLTQRGMRATQQLICETLRLDYDTFVNAAYLRQGRADEFMVKRPSERKQILADLLKLSQYDTLAERAKVRSRQAQAQTVVLETTLTRLQGQLDQRSAIAQEAVQLQSQLTDLQAQQQDDQSQLQHWREVQTQRQEQQQRLTLHQQQAAHLAQQRSRLDTEIAAHRTQQLALEATLAEAATIEIGWQRLQALQVEEEDLAHRFGQLQALQQQHQAQIHTYQSQKDALEQQRHQAQRELDWVDQQGSDLAATVAQQDDIAAAMAQLQAARDQLRYLDQQQAEAAPLIQRQREIQTQLTQAQAQITAEIQALNRSALQLQQQMEAQPQLQQAAVAVGHTLDQLMARRAYQEQVREKGLERRSFMERLQATQRSYEVQLAQIDQKLEVLMTPGAPCPFCDHPLDPLHWQLVRSRHHQEREEIQRDIWGIHEQLTVSEREIQVLRQEYRDLEAELAGYGTVLERRGQLQAQLDSSASLRQDLATLLEERQQLEQTLSQGSYAPDLQAALAQVTEELLALAYDERDHALVRGQVDRLRWAEIKQAEIHQAQRKQGQLQAQRPQLERAIADLTQQLMALEQSVVVQNIQALGAQITALDYSLDHHQQVRADLRQAQTWAVQYAALQQARDTLPHVQHQGTLLAQRQADLEQAQATLTLHIQATQELLTALPEPQGQIVQLEGILADRQQQRENILARTGALHQQLEHLEQLQAQQLEHQQTLLTAKRQGQVYQELATAFGRNGLQALLIENVLPQLEAETNQLLGRLSAHQLHVQFVTQRTGRNKAKLIDTLDILIADAQGTRPYETYSGGEAFRVNFAIRLALARLLAQRSGTPLQMLIIDEGFGTQDQDGCDRLVGAINAIAADFSCILAVTHVSHFREAFQTRIDVIKTPDGSQLQISL
ncbi:AAA family ATPase [Leptolyngbya sp. PCC 6406]|uniref:exonuclease subunit SbcC n=1 Tax=Leptolyngbya sp. PCC 6406 TaxID=1173264 RepID=UPI0002AC0078|nr:SMC family ATPase [Leptolyngbya sp. PCC 6406]